MPTQLRNVALRTTVIYLVFAGTWILVSDTVLTAFTTNQATINHMQTYKGWAFVVVTAALLHFALFAQLRRWAQEADARRRAEIDALSARATAEEGLARLRTVMNTMQEGLIVVDQTGKMLEANSATIRIFGFDPNDPRRNYLDFAETFVLRRPDEQPMPIEEWPIPRTLRGESFSGYELEVHRPDTNETWFVSFSGAPVFSKGGAVELAVLSLHDDTRRRTAERERNRTLALLRAVTFQTTDAVFVKDQNGVYVLCNEAASQFAGRSVADVIGRHDRDLFDPPSAAMISAQDRRVLQSGIAETHEERLTAAGVTRVYLTTKAPYRDETSKVIGTIGISRDITDRIEREQELRRSENRLQLALAATKLGVFELDLATNELFWSVKFIEIFKTKAPDNTCEAFKKFIHPADLERVQDGFKVAMQEKRIFADEFRIVRDDGEIRWMSIFVQGYYDENGVAIRANGTLQDITDRKLAEHGIEIKNVIGHELATATSVKDAATRVMRSICECESWDVGAFWEVDKDNEKLRCIDVLCPSDSPLQELVEAARGTVLTREGGLTGEILGPGKPQMDQQFGAGDRPSLIGAQAGLRCHFSLPILLKEKVTGIFEFWGHESQFAPDGLITIYEAVGNQIGQFIERIRAQEEHQRFISLSPMALYALDLREGGLKLAWMTENIVPMTGFSIDEVMQPDWWVNQLHPHDRERVLASFAHFLEVGHLILEYRLARKDKSYIWLRDEKRLIRNAQGVPQEAIGSWSDISSRVGLEEQLRHSQKLEAVGILAGGVAHDFNNLLTIITGYSELILSLMTTEDPNRGYLAEVRKAGERAASLTRQLLAFSRKQVLEPRVIDLNDAVRNIEKMLRRLIGEDILLETVYDATNWIRVDSGQLEQVVLNIAVNARDAMPRGGRFTIQTQDIKLDAQSFRTHMDCRAGKYVVISFTDTGFGMTEEISSRMFEPFFTTKGVGKGTGLGMATVFEIIKQSDGVIDVESQVNVGTTIKIYLPAVDAKGVFAGSKHDKDALLGGNEAILLVEDEAIVRQIAKLTLESSGYRVFEAESGKRALEIAAQHKEELRLVLSDVVMPEMSGGQLSHELKSQFPGLRVLFMSGYTDDTMIRHGVVIANQPFLHKPFAPTALIRKVREVLDAKPELAPA